jgi:bla regulator protein blaR1
MMPLQPLANHLWQATVFAAVAGLLALALRNNRPQVRYWLWLAASVKFLIPFSILVDVGSHFGWHPAPAITQSVFPVLIEQVSQPFAAPVLLLTTPAAAPPSSVSMVSAILLAVWAIGFVTLVSSWWLRWRRLRAALRMAAPLHLPVDIEVLTSPAFAEPGVFGIRRPVLLLPAGIISQLTPPQLEAILAHELCHVRRRDNLATAIHMAVEALFWFHPLVWWLGARLMDERERACDEDVLLRGSEPQVYAEGILKICELYLESPLPCVSGVTGANLKKRIEAIMSNRVALRLSFARKAALVGAGVAALAGPVTLGVMNASAIRAQSQKVAAQSAPVMPQSPVAAPPEFDAASIKPFAGGGRSGPVQFKPGRAFATSVTAYRMVLAAYDLREDQLSGGPGWLDSERFALDAKTETPADENRLRLMLQTLLSKRFQLVAHGETREMQVYALTVGKNGTKLREWKEGDTIPSLDRSHGAGGIANKEKMKDFVDFLNLRGLSVLYGIDRPVLDKTGLEGTYLFFFSWETNEDFMAAVEDQLRLKFEKQRASVETLVIDRIEKPSEN